MKHIIIGTAGHIDHGKTALVRALTGRNTDRLIEEQKRGITIDLGFTWFDMKDGTRCGIIDVPGHEKFIRNMTAGVVGMDLVLMVVAADEGIMPQTREHLDILELLGIEKTILVISKCDLVDEEWLGMMEKDIREDLKGTIMENAPAARVSSTEGKGIDELKDLIFDMVKNKVEAKDTNGIPRLPVDRVFTLPGFGTIVTGTLISGSISKGEQLDIFPAGLSTRIRSIQVHEAPQDRCEAGQRVALNLQNIKKTDIRRGCVLAPAGSMENTSRIDVSLTVLKDSRRIIRNRQRLHLYTGTSEILCRAVLLDKQELQPGETGLAELVCEEEIVVRRGDRFVVRFYSPLETIGGGVVLESNAVKKKRFRADVIEDLKKKESGSFADVIEAHIRAESDNPVSLKEMAKSMARSAEELQPYLRELVEKGAVLEYPLRRDIWYRHADNAFITEQKITRALLRYSEQHPYRFGIPKTVIRDTFMKHVKPNLFDECVNRMTAEKRFEVKGQLLCLPGYEILKDGTFLEIEKLLTDTFERAGYQMLRFTEIEKKNYSDELVTDVLNVMMDEGKAVRMGNEPETYTMKHFMDDAEERIRKHFLTDDILTIAQVREMFGTNRKCARLIVGYMDGIKVTKKVGAETERVAYT